jgi:hypothetical protein
MADSIIFHRLSDNANDIGREVVRKAVKAILAETDADVITIKRADRDRIAMIECYVGGGEFYLVVTPDNKISMRLVTDIPGSSSSTYAITTIERGAKNGKKIRVAVRKIVTEDRVTRYLYSCLSVSETGTSEIGFKEIASEDNSTKKVYVSVRARGKKGTLNWVLISILDHNSDYINFESTKDEFYLGVWRDVTSAFAGLGMTTSAMQQNDDFSVDAYQGSILVNADVFTKKVS